MDNNKFTQLATLNGGAHMSFLAPLVSLFEFSFLLHTCSLSLCWQPHCHFPTPQPMPLHARRRAPTSAATCLAVAPCPGCRLRSRHPCPFGHGRLGASHSCSQAAAGSAREHPYPQLLLAAIQLRTATTSPIRPCAAPRRSPATVRSPVARDGARRDRSGLTHPFRMHLCENCMLVDVG